VGAGSEVRACDTSEGLAGHAIVTGIQPVRILAGVVVPLENASRPVLDGDVGAVSIDDAARVLLRSIPAPCRATHCLRRDQRLFGLREQTGSAGSPGSHSARVVRSVAIR
jgi:hypothetical protein